MNISQLKGAFIVSCQAYETEEFYGAEYMEKMARSAVKGGADAVRLCWPENIRQVKNSVDVPIIGINKQMPEGGTLLDSVFITPTIESAIAIKEAGCDVLAFDGTFRCRTKEELGSYIEALKGLGLPLMADISTLEEAVFADSMGVDIVSTTLSGYTRYSVPGLKVPNLPLVREVRMAVNCLVNAEGRYRTTEQVNNAYEAGADMVTVGGAITRPEEITEYFVQSIIRKR